jgi:hypothetical protein
MTTLRGSFSALRRLVERKLQQLCTALRHPQPLHIVALRKTEHPAANHPVGEASVTSTPTCVEAPTPVEDVERAPFGFEIPDEDDSAQQLQETARRGEQERASVEERRGEALADGHAPVIALIGDGTRASSARPVASGGESRPQPNALPRRRSHLPLISSPSRP